VFSGTSIFTKSVTVGYSKDLAVENFYSGSIDEVRIWCSDRSNDLIIKNFQRTIFANHSGGLKLYWKFNQSQEYGNKIVDYSGNSLHGTIAGTPNLSTTLVSGTLGSWFKDSGDAIFNLENARVNSFLSEQRLSASNYDDSNSNMIFNLVPSYFTEGDNTEYQQLFLLLTARHYDRLKLYIDHLSNVGKLTTEKFNGPPANLLDLAAENYGIDIGGVFSDSNPLQYFYGEDVNSSGSLDVTIKSIREILKRNVLSNLAYIIKTKSTRQALKAAISSLGLDENVISVSEYTDFSGGIRTTYTPRTVEARVANFLTSSLVHVSSSAYTPTQDGTIQFRVLFNTGSSHLSQSLYSVYDTSGSVIYGARVERANSSSSFAKFRLFSRDGVSPGLVEATSSIEAFSNKWINFTLMRQPTLGSISYKITSADRVGILFSSSNFLSLSVPSAPIQRITLGTSGSNFFSGAMQEFRAWRQFVPSSSNIDRWGLDWQNTEVNDLEQDINKLVLHLKLNDFTSSVTGGGQIHDYVNALSGNSYSGFPTSSQYAFPGKYIDRFESSISYDLSTDNDKIRIKNDSEFYHSDKNFDIPFVSINFSPINSLNKEIFKWVGDISKLSNILGETTNRYRETNAKLNSLKSIFFKEKVESKIDYEKFSNVIKWFDNNFANLLNQLIPLDVASSISSYVIEPHILELNSVKKNIAASDLNRTFNLQATIAVTPSLELSSVTTELSLADPGRFGSFISASAEISEDVYFTYATSSEGVNYSNRIGRKIIDTSLQQNYDKNSPNGYGNGFVTTIITGSNYLKNTLNVVPNFMISGVYYVGGGAKGTNYLSSSHGQPRSPYTASFDGYQDARWLWMQTSFSGGVSEIVDETRDQWNYDAGIGYGGLWGQLRYRSNKSTFGRPMYPSGSKEASIPGYIGENVFVTKQEFSQYITVYNSSNLKTVMIWPLSNAFDGVELFFDGTDIKFKDYSPAASFGQSFDIEGYNTLNIEILGRTNKIGGFSNQTNIFFELKFQFFSKDTPGTFGFENAMSSSISSGAFTTDLLETKYVMKVMDLPKDSLSNFNLTMERNLPKQKFMRVFITPYTNETGNEGSFFVSAKGILSDKQSSGDNIPAVRR
jgi:hypothetical protein